MTKRLILRISAAVIGISGLVILAGVIVPIASYQEKNPTLLTPVIEENKDGLGVVDYTKASNWFVGGAGSRDFSAGNILYYTLSIPKLKIENATVAIGGEDLEENLIQYPGTALPGEKGNSVIFGHSILPLFYDPKRYISIFSLLPTLGKGDEIFVSYDGVAYRYQVEEMFEIYPTDLQVLKQNSSDSFLTLVTCTPPGHPLKPRRLIVRARLVPFREANATIKQ